MTTFVDNAKLNATDLNNNLPPIGCILPYSGPSAPNAEWLLCNGAAISRTTYSVLFARIGTTYGAGDGSTTFNIPSMNTSKVPIMYGSGSYASLGASTGHNIGGGTDVYFYALNFIIKAK